MDARRQRRAGHEVMHGRVGHHIDGFGDPAPDQLLVRAEHPRPGAEQLLSQLSGLFGGLGARVTDGNEVELPRADVGDRGVGAQMAAPHAAASDQCDRYRVHSGCLLLAAGRSSGAAVST